MASRTTSTLGPGALAILTLALVGFVGGRTYHSEAMRVASFTVPGSWESAPQGGYPNTLVAYSHPDGARIVLTGEHSPKKTAVELAAQAIPALGKQGFRVKRTLDGERVRIEGQHTGLKRLLRQVYVCASGYCYVLTLVAPDNAPPQTTRDFEESIRTFTLMPALESAPSPADGGTGASDGGRVNVPS